MRLLIDIGNSNIVIATSDNSISDVFRINTSKNYTEYEYSVFLNPILEDKDIEGAIISSVVPEITRPVVDYLRHNYDIEPIIIGPGVKTGINVKTDNPKEVGTDLIATAAAVSDYGSALIVDLGTATTFTYVDKNVIRGVVITTGLKTSMKALVESTSLLHEISLEPIEAAIGTNTTESLRIGLVNGHAYMVEAFIKRISRENTKVVLTGGFASLVNKILGNEYEVRNNLLLEGLDNIFKRNLK